MKVINVRIVKSIFVCCLCILLTFLLYCLFSGKHYTIKNATDGDQNNNVVLLHCDTHANPKSFFSHDSVASPYYQLKFMFENGVFASVNFSYSADLRNNVLAKDIVSRLQARYNIYLSNNGKEIDIFSPVFTANGNNININLSISRSALDSTAGRIILFNEQIAPDFSAIVADELKAMYEEVGFSCTYY